MRIRRRRGAPKRVVIAARTFAFISAVAASAFLIFWLEPMVGRILLPSLGGSPSVWNVCMVVYQIALLLGYALALGLARLRPGAQLAAHLFIAAAACLTLPIAFAPERLASLAQAEYISASLAGLMFLEIGLPFVALALVSPLLQTWWAAASDSPSQREPYFLYAASNAGSFLGLLGYPFFIERNWSLATQRNAWAIAFIVCTALIFLCRALIRLNSKDISVSTPAESITAPSTVRLKLKWVALALIPSSLTLGTTTYLSSDVASLPLLWVIPLALYLLTFVIAFGARSPKVWVDRALPPCAIALLYLWTIRATEPPWLIFLTHLSFLFLASLACHQRLAALRPHPRELTQFYLLLSVGGALGGIFNSLIAPLIFVSVLEYPLMILLATAVRVRPPAAALKGWKIPALAGGLGAVAALTGLVSDSASSTERGIRMFVICACLIASFFCSKRPFAFASALALILVAVQITGRANSHLLRAERNFFGVSRVALDPATGLHTYYHGTTVHGTQFQTDALRCQPLAYYHQDGPLGDVFNAHRASRASRDVAAIGLGAGAVVTYAQRGEEWTFYEIDPTVVAIARDPKLFSYLSACADPENVSIVLGDGRLEIQKAPTNAFGLLVLDAFTSDAIPTHLLTREAFALYLNRVGPDGLIACHISSRHLDLAPILAAVAHEFNLHCVIREDAAGPALAGTFSSRWAALTASDEVISTLIKKRPLNPGEGPWLEIGRRADVPIWTDDFVDILSVIEFR